MPTLDHPILFLATADAGRARAFYERVLGLPFIADEPAALVFRVNGSMLRIQKVERVHAAPYTALGWEVADIRRAVHELRAAGIAFQRYPNLQQDDDVIWQSPATQFKSFREDQRELKQI